MVKEFTQFFSQFEWIVEKRDLNVNHKFFSKKSLIYKKHVNDFKKKEKKYFKDGKIFFNLKKKKVFFVERSKINNLIFNKKISKVIKKFKPQILFSYGCQKIDVNRIDKKIRLFNIHGGLIPKYRGVNTNFWPHKNKESNYIGLTLHEIKNKFDSGNIFFQTSINILKNKDNINSLSCRAVKNFCEEVPVKIFYLMTKNINAKGIKYKFNKKIYTKKDFSPSEILQVYKNFELFKKRKVIKKPKLSNLF